MKKIFAILVLLIATNSVRAQFPTTDSLERFINRYIRNSAVESFQNLRLNTALIGMLRFLDSAYGGQIASISATSDTTFRIITLAPDTLTTIVVGRRWTLQQVLTNGSVLTSNHTITIADSITYASGKVLIDQLRLTGLVTQSDTTNYKPLAMDALGNVVGFDRWPGGGGGGLSALPYKPNLFFVDSSQTLSGGAEASLIMQGNGTTVDEWYRLVGGTTIYYRTANNALLDNWGSSTTCTGVVGEFPTVFRIGTTYYMFLKPTGSEDIFLYSSTNKTTWSAMNGGSAVITHSSTATDWYRNLYNVGVAVVGTKLHILVEGSANSGQYAFPSCLGYATADISSPTFTLQSVPQIRNGANPDIHYVPERNALVVLYSHFGDLSTPPTTYYAAMVGGAASLSGNLTDSTGWQKSSLLFPSIDNPNSAPYVADQSMVFTPGKTYPALMYYNYAQTTGYQAYAYVSSPLELLESLPLIDGPRQQPSFWRLGINGVTQPRYPLDVNGEISTRNGYRINDNLIWYTTSGRLTTNQELHFGNTGTEFVSGDNSNGLYLNGAMNIFGRISDAYKIVLNANGLAINNSSTGAASGVGLHVASGETILGSSTTSGKKLTINVNSVNLDGIQFNNAGSAPAAIGFGGMVSASAANPLIYSDGNYLVLNSKAGSPLYFNFDNANSGSYVDWFNGKMRLTQPGNLMLGSTSDNGARFQVTGKSSFSDTGALAMRFSYSSNIHGSFTRYSLIDKDYIDSVLAALGGGGNGIYGGSGSLPSDVTVSGAGNDLNLGDAGDKLAALTTNVTGTSTYNSNAHTFNDGAGHSFGMTSAGFFMINGSLNAKVERATDANTSVTTSSCVFILPAITANRTLSLPATAREGMIYIIINTNSSGNTWQFGGGGSLVDQTGAAVTSFTNGNTYIIMGDSSANIYRILTKQ